jgi:molybdenum cofactor biosynthesis protein MoaC
VRPRSCCVWCAQLWLLDTSLRWEHLPQKGFTTRIARASAIVHIGTVARDLVRDDQMNKGDVMTTAQLAGIMGAKCTSMLIPLCHNITISKADVRLHLHDQLPAVCVLAEVRTVGQTGVEMEALTAASVAALTVFDMCKAVTKEIVITDLQLDFKCGGKSGVYERQG